MPTPVSPPFTADCRVGDIVAARPAVARVFERFGIDYCCGGKLRLIDACSARDLDPDMVLEMVEACGTLSGGGAEVDPAGLSLTELADHIESTHHAYVKAELPRLIEMADRVARKHGGRDGRLAAVAETVHRLADEMTSHMRKEEFILFPLVRRIEAGESDGFFCGSIANPIRVMEAEHASAGDAVARLRELTDGFLPGPGDCNTHRLLLAELAEFASDLQRHVHKENNVLFPRALARAGANGQTAG